jgi:hypothetical protein
VAARLGGSVLEMHRRPDRTSAAALQHRRADLCRHLHEETLAWQWRVTCVYPFGLTTLDIDATTKRWQRKRMLRAELKRLGILQGVRLDIYRRDDELVIVYPLRYDHTPPHPTQLYLSGCPACAANVIAGCWFLLIPAKLAGSSIRQVEADRGPNRPVAAEPGRLPGLCARAVASSRSQGVTPSGVLWLWGSPGPQGPGGGCRSTGRQAHHLDLADCCGQLSDALGTVFAGSPEVRLRDRWKGRSPSGEAEPLPSDDSGCSRSGNVRHS